MLRFALSLMTVLLSSTLLAQAAPKPPAEITNLVNTLLRATNSDDSSLLAGIYTSNATVVDENAPYVWTGSGSGVAWWHVVDATLQKMKLSKMHAADLGISEFTQSSNDAYMIVPMLLTGSAAGKPFKESGTMTYTFHRAGNSWKISSQVWTTKP